MKRYDLRNLKSKFYDRMVELAQNDLDVDEVGIFLFEVGDFSSIQKSADVVREIGYDLMNSLKFNEVDWTIVVKRLSKEESEKNIKIHEALLSKKKQEAQENIDNEAEKSVSAEKSEER